MAAPVTSASSDLASFVPRLTLEWLRDHPDRLWTAVDGTVAFVDISGFTAMSEKLSSLGKAGAEEVTDVMNATFAALLQVAYDEGGGLLKFGGDALLLLYTGDDHARHAARAAFGMRKVLRAIGRPRTSAGAVQLRMHAGIHSGTFQFFLVGDSHRELLITGPSATRTVEMEATSEAGEILVSPETAALLDPEAVGEQKGKGFLLQAEPAGNGEPAPLPDLNGIPLEIALPEPLRAQLLEVGPLEGEHRNGAVAFVRFSGVDDVLESEGPEAVADGLDALVRALQMAAGEHRVTFLESDIDRDGGRIILVAGAPQTFGDDEERLLRTLRAAVDTGLPFPVHIGASRGRVFTGQVGASFRRTYTLLGDTAALAARLMARSGEDEIWIAAEAYARGGRQFDATELEPFTVKGKAEPVHAVVLGELRAAPSEIPPEEPSARGKLPFVDRERERAVLGAAVAPVRMGFGTLVELIGEPGIGKSRLAEELRENCADMAKIGARCDQYEASTAYYPFRPMLRSLLGVELNGGGEHNRQVLADRLAEVDEDLVPWAPLLAAPLDVEVESTPEVDDLDPAFWRARLHGVMGRLLGGLLDAPTLLLFEDVHWMDDASSELLRFLGTQLPTKPWLACTTRRPVEGGFTASEGTPPLPALTLRLEPIPEEDAKALVRAAAGDRRLSDDELAALMERGAGNPLFLQELASGEEHGEEEELPETVQALVATRIDKLSPGDRALLRWASVLGVTFSGALITDVLEGESDVAAASSAWARLEEFVEMDPNVPGGFRFRHALIRDAAYEGLSFKRRRELHGRIGDVIARRDGDEAAELLSLHFYRGERWPEAWRYSVEAGTRAWEKYASVESAEFFERALEAARHLPGLTAPELARVWEALGDARMRTGAYERAGEAFRAARKASPGDMVEQARVLLKEAMVPLRLAQHPQALRRLGRALRTLDGLEGPAARVQRARIFSWYARVHQRQRRPRDAVEWSEKTIAEAQRANAPDALAHAYRTLDWAYMALGRPDEAVHSRQAVAIYEELGDLDSLALTLNNLGGLAFMSGRWDDAVAYVERAREAWDRIGDMASASVAAFNLGQTLSDQGKIGEAEPLLREALEIQKASGNLLDVALTASALGRLAARAGRYDEARTYLEEARALCREEGDEVELLTADVRALEALVLQGDVASLEVADSMLERTRMTEGVSVQAAMLHRLRGWALVQAGDLDGADSALRESLRIATAGDANFGGESADYDAALTLDALVHVGRLRGDSTDSFEAERDQITAKLGVVALPRPPLRASEA
jgi:class 3 adenylate cyclase/tetratricopeptide (TPR) repeat protein